jgi:phosphoribosylformylglycinamidine synthase
MPTVAGVKVDLTPLEIRKAKKMLGREPNAVEIGMIDTMWSEHCSYKSSRNILKILPRKSSRVIVGPGYDAGVIDIGDGYAVAFKVESHNHPSAIEPYNGAATGIGGIVRDILCVGARPIALLDSLKFGSLNNGHSKWLFQNVVKGIAGYGNCIGVPTVAGDVEFDDSFETNCLVNVACAGLVKKEDIILAETKFAGDILVLVGGSTGRDGIHGVTFASKTITEKSEEDRPAVQIGDPFTKKLTIEAVLEALKTGCVNGLKDLGGGGLTCALSEMSAKGGTGVEIQLEDIHVREEGMGPYELMLSESQERMLFAIKPRGLKRVLQVFKKYEIPYSVIGKVTNTGEVVAKLNGKVVAKVPSKLLAEAPIIERKAKKPKYIEKLRSVQAPKIPEDLSQTLYSLLATPNIASKEWIYRQYDHEVGVRTVVKPGEGDAAVLRIIEIPKAIAIKSDCNGRHSYLDPFNGHAGVVAEAARNVVAVGAEPVAYTDGCNFGNPRKPEVFWQFREAVKGLKYMSEALGIPCVGGNVSFYNEDDRTNTAVKPTTVVVMLGLIENLDWITTLAFKEAGDMVLIIGETYPELGGSEYYHEIHGITGGNSPNADADKEKASIRTVIQSIRNGLVNAVHDCSKGGLAVALALMSIKGKLGATINLDDVPASNIKRIDELLFSETYSRFIVSSSKNNAEKVLKIAYENNAPAGIIGKTVDSDQFTVSYRGKQIINCSVQEMERGWRETIPRALGVIY